MTENVIEWYTGNDTVTVTFTQSKHKTKIRKLAEQYPNEVEIVAENKDGSLCAHVPLSYIRIMRPRDVSEEERERLRQRARNNFNIE